MNEDQELQTTDEELFVPPDATPAAETVAVTRERLEEVNANPDLLTDPEEINRLKPYIMDGEEWPEAAAVTETDEEVAAREANETAAAAATPPADETPTAGAASDDDDSAADDLAVHRATVDAVAELRKTHKAEVARLNAILDAPEPEDFTDEHREWERTQRATLLEKSKLQDKFQEDFAEATTAAQAQTVAIREADRFLGSFDKVAARTPEVKLDRPFKAANAAYAEWLKNLEGAAGITEGTPAERMQAAYAKYQSDPTLAAAVPPPKDMEKVQLLNAARELVDAAGGKRSLDGAVLEVLNTRGLLAARSQQAATAASRASAEATGRALARAASAPVTAPIGGKAKTPSVLTAPVDLATAEIYLTNLLNKRGKGIALTTFESQYENQAKKLIGLDPVR